MIDVPVNIRQLCEKDSCRKNFRVHFINGEHGDLTNDDILTESVVFTESICSGSLKFGMCESSVLSFECALDENLKGAEISAQIEIDISTESQSFINEYGQTSDDVDFPFYPITYGEFVIKDCKKTSDGRRKVNAYTVLLGDEKITSTGTMSFYEYGLSEFETCKMHLMVDNTDYGFNVARFMYSNIDKIKLNVSETSVSIPESSSAFPVGHVDYRVLRRDTQAQANFTCSSNPKNYVLESLISNNGDNLYRFDFHQYTQAEVQQFVNECVSDFCGSNYVATPVGMSYTLPDYKNKIYAIYDTNSASATIEKSRLYYPYFTSGTPSKAKYKFVLLGDLTVTLTNNDTGVSRTYTKTNPITCKRLNTSSFNTHRISFPRSKMTIPYTTYDPGTGGETITYMTGYALDYVSLMSDGLEVTKKNKKGVSTTTVYKFSFRDMVESFAELQASFGMYWRHDGSFSFDRVHSLDRTSIDSLRVGSSVPDGAIYQIKLNQIEDSEFDDSLTKLYSKVICTCSPSDENEEQTLTYANYDDTNDNDNYLTYDLSSNYYIKTFPQTKSEITAYLQTIANAIRTLRYMPCEINLIGLPFLEAGDWIEFETKDGVLYTNALTVTLTGIQNLRTTIESEG